MKIDNTYSQAPTHQPSSFNSKVDRDIGQIERILAQLRADRERRRSSMTSAEQIQVAREIVQIRLENDQCQDEEEARQDEKTQTIASGDQRQPIASEIEQIEKKLSCYRSRRQRRERAMSQVIHKTCEDTETVAQSDHGRKSCPEFPEPEGAEMGKNVEDNPSGRKRLWKMLSLK